MDSHPLQAQSPHTNVHPQRGSEIHQRLKHETAELHRLAEQENPFFEPALDLVHYARLLNHLGHLWGVLELWALDGGTAVPGVKIPVASQSRIHLLGQDMHRLGQRRSAATSSPWIPKTIAEDSLSALGCLYVLTGSRIGGHVIGRHLMRQFRTKTPNAFSFWLQDASKARQDLKDMLESLEKLDMQPQHVDRIVLGAKAAFQIWRFWMQPSLLPV